MPTEPEVEDFAAALGTIDEQIVALAMDRVPFGLAIFDLDGRLTRCNRTWASFFEFYFGVEPGYATPGRHITDLVPENADAIEELFAAVSAGKVVRQAAHRLALPGMATYWDVLFAPLYQDGRIVGALDIVTDATDRVRNSEQLERRISAFTAIADAITLEHPLEQTLRHVAGSVRSATGAEAAAFVVWEDEDLRNLSAYGDDGLPDGYRQAVEAAYALGVDSPIRNVTTASDVTVIRGFRTRAERDPGYAPLHPMWSGMEFEDTVVVPLGARGRCVGCLLLYVSADREVDAAERAFLHAVADQSAVAVENSRLYGDAESHATLVERQRLARELHDSVSQALFSMTMHVRTAERRLEPLGEEADLARAEVARLQELTRGALAEMRALIFELRPGALADEGLGAALTKQAAAIAAREQVTIEVVAPTRRLPLSTDAEEHLYRIALEAMHNAVKHARPRRIDVTISIDDTAWQVALVVTDDGIGFDTSVEHLGHLGLGTMRERAAGLGGTATLASAPGAGTRVTVVVPVDATHPRG